MQTEVRGDADAGQLIEPLQPSQHGRADAFREEFGVSLLRVLEDDIKIKIQDFQRYDLLMSKSLGTKQLLRLEEKANIDKAQAKLAMTLRQIENEFKASKKQVQQQKQRIQKALSGIFSLSLI